MRKVLALALMVGVTGCNLAPKHVTPTLSTPIEFPPEVNPVGARTDIVSVSWEDFYQDERLRELVVLALENNRDLRIAVLRIEEARGLYRIQRADQLPQLGLSEAARSQ